MLLYSCHPVHCHVVLFLTIAALPLSFHYRPHERKLDQHNTKIPPTPSSTHLPIAVRIKNRARPEYLNVARYALIAPVLVTYEVVRGKCS